MNQIIEHRGTIERIEDDYVLVRILQASACSSCQAAKLCRSSESKEKLIEVPKPVGVKLEEGQSVDIIGSTAQGLKAVWWAYTFPLILLVLALFLCIYLTGHEGLGALMALAVLAVYFFLLYLFRKKLNKVLTFKLKT